MVSIPSFVFKWKRWYRVLRYRKGFERWIPCGMGCGCRAAEDQGSFIMSRTVTSNVRSDLRAHFARTNGGRSLLEIDAWIPSGIKAISPLVQRLMRLIQGSHCLAGDEYAVGLARREALSNAVVHGNKLNARKSVHVRCRCKIGKGVSLVVSDQGQGFDARTISEPVAVDVLEAEPARGIQLLKWAMDQVSFEEGGTEVHMRKVPAHNATSGTRSNSGAR